MGITYSTNHKSFFFSFRYASISDAAYRAMKCLAELDTLYPLRSTL